MLASLTKLDWDFADASTGDLTHGMHPYPAKFIPQIPHALIQELSSAGDTVLDMFCGSGTTLLEALRLGRNAIGIDANPLAAMISRAKTTPLTTTEFGELREHRAACERTLAEAAVVNGGMFGNGQAFRSSAWRPPSEVCEFWFQPHVVEELAALRDQASRVASENARALCMVALSAIVVAVSKQDSDTRYVRREKAIGPGDTVRRYLRQLKAAVCAVQELTKLLDGRRSCDVLVANVLQAPETPPLDLVVTSPPYPNAYSYHLYHRTRMIWLGHDPDRLKEVEIGSHRKYSSKSARRATPETFRNELVAIFRWLRRRLRNGRYACFVIGDSKVNGAHVDNAALIASAGAAAGFREMARIPRAISSTRKAFNPAIGRIKTEHILILQRD